MNFPQDIPRRLQESFHAHTWVGMGCALASEGKILSYSYGMADTARNLLVEARSLFDIASVGKLFTTVAILKLIETGQLTLETALEDVLQDLPSPWRRVQTGHLLTHSSGIRNYTDTGDYWKEVEADVSRDRILEYVKACPLEFEPGTRWAYSNTGFFLLGLVTEAVSQTGYFNFVKQLIESYRSGLRIVPTGNAGPLSDVVTGYQIRAGVPAEAGYYSNCGTFSAGGFSASLPDFMAFENGLFSGRILNRNSLALITRPFERPDGEILRSSDPDLGFEMTHGLFKFSKDGLSVLAHRGETRGFSSCYKRIPEKDLSVIIAVNTSDVEAVDQLADAVLEIVLNK